MPAPANVTGPVAHHAEGPVWWSGWGGLRYVDMLAGDVLALRPDGGVDRRHVGTVAAVVRPRAGGGFVVAREHDVAVSDTGDGPLRPLTTLTDGPAVRLNEGSTGPDGAFYVGGMVTGTGGTAALHRVEPGGAARVVLEGVGCSNGLGFSPDGTRAYYADTATHRIDMLDVVPASVDARGLTGRRPFVAVDPADGAPDGLTVDADGGVWVALWGGSAVRRYSPSGVVDAEIRFPATQVTACTFGGDDLGTLYVTTSRQDLADYEQPEAGSLFRVDAGVRGLPATPFAG
ncbi:SMP-30/gluconolactonase/LRE family protein [Isoptericola sp. BMS4]|uniref:SMP-30/gluconolactonase/LRE family protein n=1 Tax=Isoptericola sp. BMS4 TaxID=2527875 RepID=UPI001F0ED5EB|nr:SMP-30/gluconolactonase/LRE family protein [Isoptericola sp. BMS4]